MNRKSELFEILTRRIIVGVVREESADVALEVARTYLRHGIGIVEITLTTPEALSIITTLSEENAGSEIVIAAGSIRSDRDAAAARRAGAEILVSPHTEPRTIEYGIENDLLVVAGAATATEIVHAWELGADVVKIYPAMQLGGPDFIRTIRQPIRDVPMLAGGLVPLEQIGAYLDAGAIAVNLGGSIAVPDLVRARNWEAIGERVGMAVAKVRSLRPEGSATTVH